MKKILIIGSNAAKYQPIFRQLSDQEALVSACSYQDLAFFIDGGDTSIKCFSTGEDIKEFSKIIILATSVLHLKNYIFSALACYCRRYKIPMLDDSFSNLDGKLYALWRFWEENIPVAKTVFGPLDFMIQKFTELGAPCILKSVQGTKGKDNYLIHSKDELVRAVEDNKEKSFVLQNFIPNDGDWRIILVNYAPKLAIYRSSHGKDFRNNTSVGGDAKLVPLSQVDREIIKLATSAAKALSIKIAGADIMQNSQTGEFTVLEVNRTPQLVSGSFVEAKLEMLKSIVKN